MRAVRGEPIIGGVCGGLSAGVRGLRGRGSYRGAARPIFLVSDPALEAKENQTMVPAGGVIPENQGTDGGIPALTAKKFKV